MVIISLFRYYYYFFVNGGNLEKILLKKSKKFWKLNFKMLEFIFCKDQNYVSRTVLCAQNGGLKFKFGLAVEGLHRSKKDTKKLWFFGSEWNK